MTARLSVLLLLCAAACKPQATTTTTLRVSMIPTTDPSKAIREMEPLIDYLSNKAGAKVELTIPTTYAAVVDALVHDQLHEAVPRGVPAVHASTHDVLKPPVAPHHP